MKPRSAGGQYSANEPCMICGGLGRRQLRAHVSDAVTGSPGDWNLITCTSCGVVITDPPVPAREIGAYYDSSYSPFTIDPTAQRGRFKTLLRELMLLPYRVRFGSDARDRPPFGGRRVLEVGCGSGALLAALSRRGWQCAGLDLSEAALERARQAVPEACLFHGVLDDFETDGKFDLIVLSHVLEHLANPGAALRKLAAMLAPGGKLQIEVPNIAGTEARLFGRHWRGLDVPRHYLHFTPESLRLLLARAGFVVESQRTAFLASSIVESMQLALAGRAPPSLQRISHSRWFYFAMTPLASLSYLFGNAGAIEVLARASQESA